MNTCDTCEWRREKGYCYHHKITEDEGRIDMNDPNCDALVYEYSEGGGFWVGPKFGCIHHTPK